jgi:hypothetical protein
MGADPLSLGILAISTVGAGLSAYSAYQEGQDAKAASQYNAQIARESAAMTETAGALDVERQRKGVKSLVGTQRARYGASGIEMTGSPLDVIFNTSLEGELDAQVIDWNSKVRARGYMSQAEYDDRLAGIYERSGAMRAGSTLLTQGANIGLSYYGGYKKPTTVSTSKGAY